MPGVIPSESNGLSRGSPSKKNRLSLKFFQKKETKRALDFTDSQENEEKTSEYKGSEMYVCYFQLFYTFKSSVSMKKQGTWFDFYNHSDLIVHAAAATSLQS